MREDLYFPTDTKPLVLFLGVCLISIVVSYLAYRQRNVVRNRRLGLFYTPGTPPPPYTSKGNFAPSGAVAASAELDNCFPPSQRDFLEIIKPQLSPSQREQLGDIKFNDNTFKSAIIGWDEDYRKCDASKYVANGLSVKEIRALGDFPDYSLLTGVPHPQPYTEFDIDKAIPRPYRPLRWAYHQTMCMRPRKKSENQLTDVALTKLESDWWIELSNTYKETLATRKALYQRHGKSVLAWLPGSELACKELMEMVLQNVCHRYPQYFSLGADNQTFENKILGTKQNIALAHPLLVLLDNIPEDFGIVLRHPETGAYHLRAGMICSALGWNVGTKIGLSLDQIHAPIPDYREKMQFSMDRFFSKLPSSKPIQRGSWGLEIDKPLYMPPGDPHEKYRDFQMDGLDISRVHLRVDWQTLRRLPLSAGIVFNFKAVFTPVTEFRDEPYVPSLILKILKDGKENLMKYKNTWHTEHVVIPALREYEKEQIEKRMIEENWSPCTLDESPWFPGWEKKWHAQQGF